MNHREAEMATAIDALDNDVDDKLSEFVTIAPPRNPSQVYSIRIPVDKLEALRVHAERLGTKPSVLIRQWALEKLEPSISDHYLLTRKVTPEEIGKALTALEAEWGLDAQALA